MSLRALIFDVDGTLADSEEAHRQAFNAAFVEHALRWDWSRHEYAQLLKVAGGKERIAHYIDLLEAAPAKKFRLRQLVPALHRVKTALYAQRVAAGAVPLRPGVERLLRQAQAAGLKLAIASTTTAGNVGALLARAFGSVPVIFDVIATGDHAKRKKPAPDIYLLALARLGLAPEQCIAFEDSANGLAAAKAAGLYTVVTPTHWTAAEDFGAADLRLHSLSDLNDLAALTARHAGALDRQRSAA